MRKKEQTTTVEAVVSGRRKLMVAYILSHPELDELCWWGQVTFHLGEHEVKAQMVEAPRRVILEECLTKGPEEL